MRLSTRCAILPIDRLAKQGHAIASALAARGARTTLVTGPTHEPNPAGVKIVRIQSAQDMLNAVLAALPADIAVCAAAVADWRPEKINDRKMKKETTRQLRRLIS